MRRLRLFLIIGALLAVVPASAPATSVSMEPGGYGWRAFAGWRPNQGEADPYGRGNDALLFLKGVSTLRYAAASATFTGMRGRSVLAFTSRPAALGWDHRNDGHCNVGAPRWNLVIDGAGGQRYVVYLACAQATHSPGAEPGWTRDTFGGPQIRSEILLQAGTDALQGTIRSLLIVFDEAADASGVVSTVTPGQVYLDNIAVGQRLWRSRYS